MRIWKALIVVAAAIAVAILLIACSDKGTSTASCAWIVGDGSSGHDAKVHKVVYPGQKVDEGDYENVSYVPCNSRNFIVSDGSVKDANGNVVGDRTQLITATTDSGVEIQVALTAYWTLNQSESSMRNFYTVCHKYRCAGSKDIAGEANNSTPGWNDMLGENFGPALERAAKVSAIKAQDTIWQKRDPEQFSTLANNISAIFADEVRKTLGFQDDLFCGSGNSAWSNPDKPGEGEFNCSPVRIVVDDVRRGQVRADESTRGAADINAQRLANARALYGDNAGNVLALMDLIAACRAAGTMCIVNLGGSTTAPAVPIPPVTTPATPR